MAATEQMAEKCIQLTPTGQQGIDVERVWGVLDRFRIDRDAFNVMTGVVTLRTEMWTEIATIQDTLRRFVNVSNVEES